MKPCECKTPRPSGDPRREDMCVVCGHQVLPEWSSANIAPLFDRLADIPEIKLSPIFEHLRNQCLAREQDGRQHFGYRFLGRDNPTEAMEEIADAINYVFFDAIAAKREGDESDEPLALTAAYRCVQAYEAVVALRRERR